MDNPLTPNKIRLLINLAEDSSAFTIPRRLLTNEEAISIANQAALSKSTVNYESSSGILDLERIEAFGESALGSESLSRSTAAFNPGEMTGRSTGTDDIQLGRHSLHALDSIQHIMDKQTNEIHDIMRHSIATDYSFHSKRDLSADEASLVRREAPLPVQNSNQSYFMENMSVNNSNLSVGAYFKHRCPEFGKILSQTDSPERSVLSSAMPSITEVSSITPVEPHTLDMNKYKMDESLDCVPVRQARAEIPELNINNPIGKNYEKQTFHPLPKDKNETYRKSELNYPNAAMSVPEVPNFSKHLNPVTSSPFIHKPHVGSSKPTDILIRNMQSSMRLVTDDTQGSAENSLSISKIADYLGKQSNVSVSDMLQLNNPKNIHKKQPLKELHINNQESRREELVTSLRDSRKMETASSAGTVNTVISLDKLNINEEVKVPAVVITHHLTNDESKAKRSTRSKSPSSKSTLSTVQENYSFKSGDSPLHSSKGEVNTSHVRSPNIEYRELDKSVDWHEVLQQKHLKQKGLAKEQWADISASSALGFVGVNHAVTVTVTTLTDTWLTAKFKFDDLPNNEDLTIELPRMPLLLSPGKSEQFTVNITSNVEMDTHLPFTMHFKDAAIDGDFEQRGILDVSFQMPVIQAMSCDGVNKLTFPPIQENSTLAKSFVLLSDCPCDLQLDLSIAEGDSIFMIRSVQEIKKSDVNKVLIDRQGSTEDVQGKGKAKGMSKQLCRLSSGNAIRVTIKFHAPRISELKNAETFNGALNVNLIGVNTVLRKVDLVGSVGTVNLVVKMPANKLHLTNEPTNLTVCNTGSIPGVWYVKFMNSAIDTFPFKVAPSKFEVRPGAMRVISLSYAGAEDSVSEATIYFEDIATGSKTAIEVTGGNEKPKTFPIKTNHNIMSWVRSGRKELSLKNSTEKKVHIRCHIQGEGFAIDVPGVETRDVFCMPFAPGECRPLPIIFSPNSNVPLAATLYLACDKSNELSRKVKLFGCSSGDTVRWHGPVTYGDTALVRCESREQIALQLYNKSHAAAFVSAQVHFNLQYNSIASTAYLTGNNTIIPPRSKHTLKLCVDWAKVERRARDAGTSALAAVTALTGAEITRRRILRVLRDASGEIDDSLLDNHLKVLAGQFEKEDPNMDHMLSEFKETKSSLNELIGGLHELTAQIVLPQDFADENTIVITDDTMVEYHTLCD